MLFEPDWIIHTDGASRGNPGDASYGFAILDKQGKVVYEEGAYIGQTTNNFAEYTALIKALECALSKNYLSIEIRSDSELLVRQFLGEYKVKAGTLMQLHRQARELLTKFQWYQFKHVRREENKIADRLANAALDRHAKIQKQN